MKIDRIEIHLIRVPFDMGAAPSAFGGMAWTSVDSLFVRVGTDAGVDGWGEGWGHAACPTTRTALETLVAPAVLGRDIGAALHALSALEIALWDIAGKVARTPIATLLGGQPRPLRAYASLLRYGEPARVAEAVERTLAEGFRHLKLHEDNVPAVEAARRAAGDATWIALDTNCPWSVAESIAMAKRLAHLDLAWLEEPVWPPEDHAGLARVRASASMPIAAGENLASITELQRLLAVGGVDIVQPSVIKFGGIEAVRQGAVLARAHGVDYVPHCFYFGPGYLASLHLAAAYAPERPFELFHGKLEASPYHDVVRAKDGMVTVPDGPGLGLEPDLSVLERYRLAPPVVISA
jgi:D-galactarolactone cycloisomerase